MDSWKRFKFYKIIKTIGRHQFLSAWNSIVVNFARVHDLEGGAHRRQGRPVWRRWLSTTVCCQQYSCCSFLESCAFLQVRQTRSYSVCWLVLHHNPHFCIKKTTRGSWSHFHHNQGPDQVQSTTPWILMRWRMVSSEQTRKAASATPPMLLVLLSWCAVSGATMTQTTLATTTWVFFPGFKLLYFHNNNGTSRK